MRRSPEQDLSMDRPALFKYLDEERSRFERQQDVAREVHQAFIALIQKYGEKREGCAIDHFTRKMVTGVYWRLPTISFSKEERVEVKTETIIDFNEVDEDSSIIVAAILGEERDTVLITPEGIEDESGKPLDRNGELYLSLARRLEAFFGKQGEQAEASRVDIKA